MPSHPRGICCQPMKITEPLTFAINKLELHGKAIVLQSPFRHPRFNDNGKYRRKAIYSKQKETFTFTFTFTCTTIQARPLYEAYVLGSVSVLTRCYCSVFNVHTPVLKALRLGAVTREAGKAFHCSRVLGKKLYLRYVFLSRGTRN